MNSGKIREALARAAFNRGKAHISSDIGRGGKPDFWGGCSNPADGEFFAVVDKILAQDSDPLQAIGDMKLNLEEIEKQLKRTVTRSG